MGKETGGGGGGKAASNDPLPLGAEAVTAPEPGAATCFLLPPGALVTRGPEGSQRQTEKKTNLWFLKPEQEKMSPGPEPPRPPPQPGDAPHAARGPRSGSLRTCRRPRRGPGTRGEGAAPGSSGPGRGDRGKVGRGRGRAEPDSQGSGRGIPPRARAGAGGQGRRSRYLLLDLPVLRDDPVRGGEGPSSRHTQQGRKAEEPAWAGARWQLAPAADPDCRRHLAPPAGPLAPEAEAGPLRPPSWGGRRWKRRRSRRGEDGPP